MKRRTASALLAAALLFALLPAPALGALSSGFADVRNTDDFFGAVLWAVAKGVTKGAGTNEYGQELFLPDKPCTRAEVVTFLWRAKDKPAPKLRKNSFADVPAGSWYEEAVLWAVGEGITNGVGFDAEGRALFDPDAQCTYAHILTFLWRSQGAPEPGAPSSASTRFPDGYYSGPVSWAEYKNVLGEEKSSFDVNAFCSRGMTVQYLFRTRLIEPYPGEWYPAVAQRGEIVKNNALCGALLVGQWAAPREKDAMIYQEEYWRQMARDADLTSGYPFLAELPGGHVVQTGGGRNVFLVIPADPAASVTVERVLDINEGVIGEVLYHSEFGSPILLCCNYETSVPDARVTIVDSKGAAVQWLPLFSKTTGKVDGWPKLEGVYDMTPYLHRPSPSDRF